MIDVTTEKVIAIKDVPTLVPGRPALMTVYRWLNRGVRGRRLETVLVGGKRYTSQEAITRFIEETTAAADGRRPKSKKSNRRQAAIDKAEKELEAAGI